MPETLAQQDLFVPTPTRRLIVPDGCTAFYGVDSSTKRVAIATISADGLRGGDVVSFPALEGASRLAAIRQRTLELASSLVDLLPPGVIVVEEPSGFGDRPNPQLAYAVGAILCALAEAAPQTHVELVASAKWKKAVCGYGGIRKPKPGSGEEYAVLRWARSVGYLGSSWDEADAWAIADYGRRTFALDQR